MDNLDWSWKDKAETSKTDYKFHVKLSKKDRARRKKAKKKELSKSLPKDFYSSKEWRRLRYRVLKKFEGCCMLCGRSKRDHNVVLHVDHIKPKSKYPKMALDFENLQILCEDCNLGKSNKCEVDWRPEDNDFELEILNEALNRI